MQREHSVWSVRKWRQCRRRYKHEVVDGVQPRAGKALVIGIATHAALEVFDKGGTVQEAMAELDTHPWDMHNGEVEQRRTRAMVRAYFSRWESTRAQVEVIESERPFTTPLGPSILKGRNDSLWRVAGRLFLVERKTTSEEVSTVGADYWQRLALDIQVTVYPWEAARRHGTLPSILYDVIRKPLGSPKMKEKVSKRKAETPEEYEARKAAAYETLEEFEERLVQEMLDKADEYLVRREVHRTAEQNAAIMDELREELATMDSYEGSYPRNDQACTSAYGACPFLGVCTGMETLDSDKFTRRTKSEQQKQHTQEQPNVSSDSYSNCPI